MKELTTPWLVTKSPIRIRECDSIIGNPSNVQVICGKGDPIASHLSEYFDPGSRIVDWNRCVKRGGDVGGKSRFNLRSSWKFSEFLPLKELAVTKLVQSRASKRVVKMIVDIGGKLFLQIVLA